MDKIQFISGLDYTEGSTFWDLSQETSEFEPPEEPEDLGTYHELPF